MHKKLIISLPTLDNTKLTLKNLACRRLRPSRGVLCYREDSANIPGYESGSVRETAEPGLDGLLVPSQARRPTNIQGTSEDDSGDVG